MIVSNKGKLEDVKTAVICRYSSVLQLVPNGVLPGDVLLMIMHPKKKYRNTLLMHENIYAF